MALLHAHRWQGNLRELRKVRDLARAVCSGGWIGPEDLADGLARGPAEGATQPGAPARLPSAWPTADEHPPEAVLLLRYLWAAQWNIGAVARQLGLSRMTPYPRIHRFGIVSPNQRAEGGGRLLPLMPVGTRAPIGALGRLHRSGTGQPGSPRQLTLTVKS